MLGFVVPWARNDKNDWFCSEICSEILIRLGRLQKLATSKISPNDLYRHVTTAGYTVNEIERVMQNVTRV